MEVYALRDIFLNEELGTDYGAPFWYQAHNGLTNREQAHQIQTYYRRSTLPWFAKNCSTPWPPACPTPTAQPNYWTSPHQSQLTIKHSLPLLRRHKA